MTDVKVEDMLGRGDYEYALPFYGYRRPILIDLAFKPDEDIQRYPLHFQKPFQIDQLSKKVRNVLSEGSSVGQSN